MDFKKLFSEYGILIAITLVIILWIYIVKKKNESFLPNVGGNRIVLYYTGWCKYSQEFLPIWDTFEKQVNATMNNKVTASKVDCEANKEQCGGVVGFPSVVLHLFNNESMTYNGPRTVKGLTDFLKANI